jgi:hypothetical protein
MLLIPITSPQKLFRGLLQNRSKFNFLSFHPRLIDVSEMGPPQHIFHGSGHPFRLQQEGIIMESDVVLEEVEVLNPELVHLKPSLYHTRHITLQIAAVC